MQSLNFSRSRAAARTYMPSYLRNGHSLQWIKTEVGSHYRQTTRKFTHWPVGTIGRHTEPPANAWSNGTVRVTQATPLSIRPNKRGLMEQTGGPSNAPPVRKRARMGEPGDFKDSSFQTEIGKQEPRGSRHSFRQGAWKGISIAGETNLEQQGPHSSMMSSVPGSSSWPPGISYTRPPGRENEGAADNSVSHSIPQSQTTTDVSCSRDLRYFPPLRRRLINIHTTPGSRFMARVMCRTARESAVMILSKCPTM